MRHLDATIERIVYESPTNDYKVVSCSVDDCPRRITVVGDLPSLRIGAEFAFGGEYVDSKYGRQFQITSFAEKRPVSAEGIKAYLASGLIKGIGPALAERIVETFGEHALTIIDTCPKRLLEIPGLGDKRIQRIVASWADQQGIQEVMLFLQGYGLTTGQIVKIYREYGPNSIAAIRENPYRLADDITGFGFKTADTIARKLGVTADNPLRLESGIIYVLHELAKEGHCFAHWQQLVSKAVDMLGTPDGQALGLPEEAAHTVNAEKVIAAIKTLIQQRLIIAQPLAGSAPCLYLRAYYYAEVRVAENLRHISGYHNQIFVSDWIVHRVCSGTGGITYDPVQIDAIRKAVQSKVLVLTGGPGTGKTTTVLGIIQAFGQAKAQILLAAPTGRAAKRLTEATGIEAKTIHRLLEFNPTDGFKRNEDEPLQGDVLIIDESSMIDIQLMDHLLQAVPETMTLIFVGDIDQLPSVGAGSVLRDMIRSGVFPVVRLDKIFRQAKESRIITNAHRINKGEMPDLAGGPGTDFYFIDMEARMTEKGYARTVEKGWHREFDPGDMALEAARTIISLVSRHLPHDKGFSPQDIQVLTPMRKTAIGVIELNHAIQEAVNPPADLENPDSGSITRGAYTFREKDRVMQIRNSYDTNVFNGDIGVVTQVDTEEERVTVRFDNDYEVVYGTDNLDDLVLAY
ncbi:MAG: ATP-dependent RecD-like DNA helicase, partial [Oxalobacter sp.]|nr:ATP-dependent RecD-like DNA helicase [Oxalobacter sp.]